MKNKILKIIGIIILFLCLLTVYFTYNLEKGKLQMKEIVSLKSNYEASLTFFNKNKKLVNPWYNYHYQSYKEQYLSLFTEDYNVLLASSNSLLEGIHTIYKAYWRDCIIQQNNYTLLTSTLEENLINYLNNYFQIDSIEYSNYKSFLSTKLLEDGYYSNFHLINEKSEIRVWKNQYSKYYTIKLPFDTLSLEVLFISDLKISGFSGFAQMDVDKPEFGGWPVKGKNQIICVDYYYEKDTELFRNSYLKHEAQHVLDKTNYPKLSAADLEYRAKLVELIYLEDNFYQRLLEFSSSINATNRAHAHDYANFILLNHISKSFNFEMGYDLENKIMSLKKEDVKNTILQLLIISNEELKNKDASYKIQLI
jgi:hypothetical protein